MRINDGRVVPNFIGQALRGGVFRRSQAGAQKSRTMTGDRATRRYISLSVHSNACFNLNKNGAVSDGVLHVRLLQQGEALLLTS